MILQTAYAIKCIPPADYRDYNVDVLIRIYRDDERFEADIFADEQAQRMPIGMTIHDLKELNVLLQGVLENIVWSYNAGESSKAFEDDSLILSMAERGHYAFRKIFRDSSVREVIQEITNRRGKITLQIVSEDFFLPWELLYPIPPDEQLSYEHFWGMRFVIARIIPRQRRPEAFVSPTIRISSCPYLGLLADMSLPAVATKEAPFFKRLQSEGKIKLEQLQELNADRKLSELKKLKSFWKKSFHLVHFAGHAFYVDDTPSQSYMVISTEFPITLQDLEVYDLEIKGKPLFVMNACETGNINPLFTAQFVTTFLNRGARGVVATEWVIPDSFAADFAEQLYGHLLAGEQLGDSLLAARRYFLLTHHNPLGLLYSMYAQPSTKLILVEED